MMLVKFVSASSRRSSSRLRMFSTILILSSAHRMSFKRAPCILREMDHMWENLKRVSGHFEYRDPLMLNDAMQSGCHCCSLQGGVYVLSVLKKHTTMATNKYAIDT